VLFWHTGGQPALFADRYAKPLADGQRSPTTKL